MFSVKILTSGVIIGADKGNIECQDCRRGEYCGMAGTMAGELGQGTLVVPDTAFFLTHIFLLAFR